jgi:hypothetical protein
MGKYLFFILGHIQWTKSIISKYFSCRRVGVRASEGIQQTGQTVISTVFDKNTIVNDRLRRS